MDEQNNKDYEFVTETIKKKPINKKRMMLKTIHSIGMGILAGFVACVIFAIFAPKIYEHMNPDIPDLVSIPEDEYLENIEETEELTNDPVLAESTSENKEEIQDDITDATESSTNETEEPKEVSISGDEKDSNIEETANNDKDGKEGSKEEGNEEAPSSVEDGNEKNSDSPKRRAYS